MSAVANASGLPGLVRRLDRRALIAGGLLGAGALAYAWRSWSGGGPPVLTSYEDLLGCRFTPASRAPLESVTLRPLPLPDLPGAQAVWGATGRDDRGNVWFGVSAAMGGQASARLFEYE